MVGIPSTSTYVCIECRSATGCPKNEHEVHYLGKKWRAPKKGNDSAWRKIAAGDWLWDKKAIIRKAVRSAGVPLDFWEARLRREESRRLREERQSRWQERLARELAKDELTDSDETC